MNMLTNGPAISSQDGVILPPVLELSSGMESKYRDLQTYFHRIKVCACSSIPTGENAHDRTETNEVKCLNNGTQHGL